MCACFLALSYSGRFRLGYVCVFVSYFVKLEVSEEAPMICFFELATSTPLLLDNVRSSSTLLYCRSCSVSQFQINFFILDGNNCDKNTCRHPRFRERNVLQQMSRHSVNSARLSQRCCDRGGLFTSSRPDLGRTDRGGPRSILLLRTCILPVNVNTRIHVSEFTGSHIEEVLNFDVDR